MGTKRLGKSVLSILLICVLSATFAFAEGKGAVTIGFSLYDMKIQFFRLMEKGARDYCAEKGYTLITHDEKSDETAMVSGCIDLINQGVDALLVSPFKPEALGPVAKTAKAKKIPLIIDDIGTGPYDYDAFIISDNVGGGRLAGNYLIDYFKKQGIKLSSVQVAVIRNDPSNVAGHSRGTGFIEVMKKNGVKVVSDIFAKEATADASYPLAKNILAVNPKLTAVFCTNDNMATGAAQAGIDSGKKGMLVIGFDGQDIAMESIENGSMMATVMQYPYQMGRLAVELAVKKMNGENLKYDDAKTKSFFVPVEIIDKSNVQKGIAEATRAK